ncbi:MAG TPA: hypothetical protein VMM38_09255 [Aridibacter sp.]|nr:hypothetical protein [Aridibacter sp.]
MANGSKKKAQESEVRYPLHLRVPPGTLSRRAHHVTLQTNGVDVTMIFFEVSSPLLTTDIGEEQDKELRERGYIGECCGKITMPAEEFLAFSENVSKFKRYVKERMEGPDNAVGKRNKK